MTLRVVFSTGQITTGEGQSVLTIHSAEEVDTGDIQCVISNQNGSETCSAKLKANGMSFHKYNHVNKHILSYVNNITL